MLVVLMRGGLLNKRMRIEHYTTTRDGTGDQLETWINFATVWAGVEPLRGQERYLAQQKHPDVGWRVRMRYLEGVTSKMRGVVAGKTLRFDSVMDVAERHKELQILCSEWADG